MMKLNGSDNYEHLCNVRLSKEKFPIAFGEKCRELLEQGCVSTMDEAEKMVSDMVMELEVYYHKGYGLFAVESDAVEGGAEIRSPYDGTLYEGEE